MSQTKTIRQLRLLINKAYLTYALSHQLPKVILAEMETAINDSEPCIVPTDTLPNDLLGGDIVLHPEPEDNRDVHTEHCCVIHGCRYGYDLLLDAEDRVNDDKRECSVMNKTKSQSYKCEDCSWNEEEHY